MSEREEQPFSNTAGPSSAPGYAVGSEPLASRDNSAEVDPATGLKSNDAAPARMATARPAHIEADENQSLYVKFTLVIQAALVVGLVWFVFRRDWENVFLTWVVIGLTIFPAFLSRRYRVYVPPEFQLIAAVFVFLSLFLGSAGDFYYHFWWWDIVLHTGSGFLLGIVGWIVLFLLNETDRLPPGIKPAFLCFFGVTFAVFLGVLWEIFEFTVDRFAPSINMQSLETGIVDTMQDLIVDIVGAVIVALMGLAYAKTGRYSFLVDAVRKFVRTNPRLFGKK